MFKLLDNQMLTTCFVFEYIYPEKTELFRLFLRG